MKKTKAFSVIIIIVISIILIYLLSSIMLDTTGSINQGNFRINDFVIKSTIDVEEVTPEDSEKKGFDNMNLNLSQRNNFSLLIANQVGVKEIFLDNIYISDPVNKGEIILYENGEKDERLSIDSDRINIYTENKNDQIFINLNIDNLDFLKEAKIPDNTKSVTYDGSMLKLLNVNFLDLQFKIKFNINIIDENGKINICKVNLKVPSEELFNEGISIKRQDLNNYKFYIESSIINKIVNSF